MVGVEDAPAGPVETGPDEALSEPVALRVFISASFGCRSAGLCGIAT
jgi:hypothetical protein